METEQVYRVTEAALQYLKTVLNKEGAVIGVSKTEAGWRVEVETVEYRGAGFDPTLALYEVVVDRGMKVTSYRRTHLRKLSQLTWSPTAEE